MSPSPDPIIDLIPEGYRGIAIVLFVGIPYLTRAYHALSNNGGLKGVWNAIMFGTNGPKILIATLCLLSLTSCTALTTFIASPAGRITTSAAIKLGEDLAAKGETKVLEKAIDGFLASIAKHEAQGVQKSLADEMLRLAKLEGLKAALTGAQQQYRGLTGHDYPGDVSGK